MVMVAAPKSERQVPADRTRRPIKRVEYDRLIELGYFQGEKLELLRGELVKMSPVGTRHIATVNRLGSRFMIALHDRAATTTVQIQQPLFAADESEPEPDVSVVEAFADSTKASHARLVIEVADTSLRDDLGAKAALYAESAVDEYWVVDLVEDLVHVHRDRADGGWRSITVHRAGETIAPLAFPDVVLDVASMIAAR